MYFRSFFIGILLTVFLTTTSWTARILVSEETKNGGEEESFERIERTEFA